MNKIKGKLLRKGLKDVGYGGKARNCLFLKNNFYNVPESRLYSCTEIQNYLKNKICKFNEKMKEIALEFNESEDEEKTKYCSLKNEILSISPPDNWHTEVQEIKKVLGNNIIIRSSMSIEDSHLASFAGCFDSFQINIYDEYSLWNEIKKVLASALTKCSVKRIIEVTPYFSKVQLGFFIQKYIEPKIHGVCFSRNPLNIWDQNSTCEYAFFGNSVVQGTGISYTVTNNEKPHKNLTPFWYELWQHAFTLEKKFKAAIDYEWVWDGSEFWIVQVRKVTTEDAYMLEKTYAGNIWNRELTLERFPEPLTPLAWTSISDIFVTNVKVLNKQFGILVNNIEQIALSFGGYVFANPNVFNYPEGIKIRWSHYFSIFKPIFWKLLNAFIIFITRISFAKDRKFEFSFLKLQIILILIEKCYKTEFDRWSVNKEVFLKKIKKFSEFKFPDDSDLNKKILNRMEELKKIGEGFLESDFSIFLMKDVLQKVLSKLFQSLGFLENDYLNMLGKFSNRTLEFNEECRQLFEVIKKDINGKEFLNSLASVKDMNDFNRNFNFLSNDSKRIWEDFLKKNGHIRTSWDFIKPSLTEAPWELGTILLKYLSTNYQPKKIDKSSDYFFIELYKTLIKINRIKINYCLLDAIEKLRNLMQMDEEQHFFSGLLIQESKYLIKKAEEYFLAKKILVDKDSVYFLEIKELKEQLLLPTSNLHYLTLKRQNLWNSNFEKPKPMQIPVLNTTKDLNLNLQPEENIFYGEPMSPGEAQGEVYFVEHLSDIKDIPKGAILLTTSPNPTFTALYPTLSGLVTITGGVLSHGFIAAREYGLPAISGSQQIFHALKQGMTVKINGTSGSLEILA
ncbi:PEP/pyruvate-binding domain-containing protein [Pigmentibacter sp. JX0631]|uniref:PEP/pyruvate-binding domain-containing protein n=1 Tax=Pigmentibacter sp. JX0631 TaxID=2976982 RepID=UPI0024695946|nr:PEP/pyruvate-binding domain-containing protein [Pigmentibacter sp. JX0631]WGL60600.1 PEP/pyruvate-binding domain-containing protein [Pigmentibacter sp. JX0631]